MATEKRLEFGGVPGNLALMIGLPATVYYLYFCVAFNGGAVLPGPEADLVGFLEAIRPTWRAAALFGGWFALQAALQAWMPGRRVLGTPLEDGSRLAYRMNGLASLAASAVVVAGLHLGGVVDLRVVHDSFGALITVMTIFSYVFAVFLYRLGLSADQDGHRSGHPVHDFWMGTALNPRLPARTGFDLKLFCEARPGLIGWMVINVSLALVQLERHGFVSTSMILVLLFQGYYILDYFLNEEAILTTMDIKHENFGLMLAFGDLVWVPMTYCLQAFYLVDHMHHLPAWAAVGIVAMNLAGIYIFRAVNLQKHRFRSDPENARIWGKRPEYIETRTGSKLLLSGFWGWSRHFNYVGDLLMALSWSLPCGFGSALPYYYPIYFAVLLIHRERRDHEHCSRKYGEDWERYCERVPWRIVPGLY